MFGALCTEMALGNYDLLRFWRAVGDTPAQIAAAYMRKYVQPLARGNAEYVITIN